MAAQKKPDVVVDENVVYVLRAGTTLFCKTADICAMTGKSNQWIGQLISQGVLAKRSTPHGPMFELVATLRAYCDMLEARSKPTEDKEMVANEKDKQKAEVSIKKAKAIISVLEAQELQGKMHRSEDVAAMTEDLIYTIRGMLLALPGRLAIDTANAATPAEASEIIRKEIHAVMEELSYYRYDAKKYEERVRERRSWESAAGRDAHDE